MLHHEDLLYKLRFVLFGVLAFASLLLLLILVVGIGANSVQALNSDNSTGVFSESDSPNAVLGGISSAAYSFNQTMTRASRSVSTELRSMATTTARASTTTVRGVQGGLLFGAQTAVGSVRLVVHATGSGFAFIGRSASNSLSFASATLGQSAATLTHINATSLAMAVRTPSEVLGIISPTQAVDNLIKPVDHTPVPTIDPKSPALLKAQKAMSATAPSAGHPTQNVKPQWPLHGMITTLFGEPEPPYQAVHTGLDISDGLAPGITPIKPFKPGKVVEVIHSALGLGNHVVIDHGSGVTSVYAHLNSISVKKGQQVSEKTVVGFEGTTGASTGTHLHFEIRVNGQAADPLKFIAGRP
jgi:murein DD-endopeptidase MepM/ murein hydrolase activator NlpD